MFEHILHSRPYATASKMSKFQTDKCSKIESKGPIQSLYSKTIYDSSVGHDHTRLELGSTCICSWKRSEKRFAKRSIDSKRVNRRLKWSPLAWQARQGACPREKSRLSRSQHSNCSSYTVYSFKLRALQTLSPQGSQNQA